VPTSLLCQPTRRDSMNASGASGPCRTIALTRRSARCARRARAAFPPGTELPNPDGAQVGPLDRLGRINSRHSEQRQPPPVPWHCSHRGSNPGGRDPRSSLSGMRGLRREHDRSPSAPRNPA
jgi:hypothetical protein